METGFSYSFDKMSLKLSVELFRQQKIFLDTSRFIRNSTTEQVNRIIYQQAATTEIHDDQEKLKEKSTIQKLKDRVKNRKFIKCEIKLSGAQLW